MAHRGENIYKRKDGRYEGRYVIGKTASGRTRFGYVYGRQYQTVRNQLLARKAELLGKKASLPGSGIALGRWMEDWLENEQRARVRASSYQTYLNSYERHIRPCLGRVPLNCLTPGIIQDFLETMRGKGLGEGSVRNVFYLLSAGLNAALYEGMILKNPCKKIRLSKDNLKEQRVLTQEEQKKICSAALRQNNLSALLALYTGLRLGEICALKWEDIRWEQKALLVKATVQRIRRNTYRGIDIKTVSTLAGHASARTTLDFYAHSLMTQKRSAIQQLTAKAQ